MSKDNLNVELIIQYLCDHKCGTRKIRDDTDTYNDYECVDCGKWFGSCQSCGDFCNCEVDWKRSYEEAKDK